MALTHAARSCDSLSSFSPSLSLSVPPSPNNLPKADGCYVGEVMQRAIAQGLPPLDTIIGLGYRAFTQLDVCRGDGCFFPQVEAIAEITAAYPHAYYIHTRRMSSEAHALSMDAWDGMLGRFARGGYLSRYPGQSPSNSQLDNGRIMIEAMQKATLDFFRDHGQGLRFIDVSIEESDTEAKLRAFLGTPDLHVDHKNAGHYAAYAKRHPEFKPEKLSLAKTDKPHRPDDEPDATGGALYTHTPTRSPSKKGGGGHGRQEKAERCPVDNLSVTRMPRVV